MFHDRRKRCVVSLLFVEVYLAMTFAPAKETSSLAFPPSVPLRMYSVARNLALSSLALGGVSASYLSRYSSSSPSVLILIEGVSLKINLLKVESVMLQSINSLVILNSPQV
jgi:hypothetical protein